MSLETSRCDLRAPLASWTSRACSACRSGLPLKGSLMLARRGRVLRSAPPQCAGQESRRECSQATCAPCGLPVWPMADVVAKGGIGRLR
eukprot:4365976-Prymnesium_polylepis.1